MDNERFVRKMAERFMEVWATGVPISEVKERLGLTQESFQFYYALCEEEARRTFSGEKKP